jgi:cation diffusion facilitator CzcD-associated flavoprotein CzcO
MTHEAIIVGAGFGGMGAAIQLQRTGIDDFVILEREGDLGGTWHVNRYPGLAVDIPSTTYSYSFEPNPDWSRMFAPGAELKAYCDHVADKYVLRRRMRFSTVVEGARWDEDERHWEVAVAGGELLTARLLIAATGFLSQPTMPDIPGIESFSGTVVHSTDWPDDLDLRGRRAALIGTGATAVQLVPEVAREVDELTVFQRTPIYVVPKLDRAIPPVVRRLFGRVPATQRAVRAVTDAELAALLFGVLHYRALRPFSKAAERLANAHMRSQVQDPSDRRALTPDYSFGCKRPTFSNSYFRALAKPNVTLEATSIERIEPDAIVTSDGRRTEVDTLLLATGFNLWDVNFPAIEVIGRDGRNLGKWWREGRFGSYEGMSVPMFPNFWNVASPFSYNGLSYFTTIEAAMVHMGRVLAEMRRREAPVFEVKQEAYDAFLARMHELLDDTVFHVGSCATARSYYFNQHGEATLLRPTTTRRAMREQRSFPLDDYSYA